MKVIFEFDGDAEESEMLMFLNSSKYYCALNSIQEELRQKVKYSMDTDTTYEKMYARFFEILKENGVEL